MSPARPSSRASDRLQRLLLMVPYVVRHPGTELAEIARAVGADESDLVEDLNLLFVTGLPPYGPGDLIDVEIDEGRVWIRMADYFSRPVRLTRSEALALYLRAKALVGAPGLEEAPALATAIRKLEAALGPDALGALAGKVEVGIDGRVADALAAVRQAVEARRRIRIEYYSAGRDAVTSREIEPEQLFSAQGNWYVVAWDPGVDDERLFRVDRMHFVEDTGTSFEPRGLAGQGRELYTRGPQDVTVVIRLGPGARWVSEYYEVERTTDAGEGRVEVILPAKDLEWVAKLVLRLGGEATVVSPPELADLVRTMSLQTLAEYDERRIHE